jgi:hypothetical protein
VVLALARTRNRIVPVKMPAEFATDVTLVPPTPVPTTGKREDWWVPGGGSPKGSGSVGDVHATRTIAADSAVARRA